MKFRVRMYDSYSGDEADLGVEAESAAEARAAAERLARETDELGDCPSTPINWEGPLGTSVYRVDLSAGVAPEKMTRTFELMYWVLGD
jgi:hypothetical protein